MTEVLPRISDEDLTLVIRMTGSNDPRTRALATRLASSLAPTTPIGLQRNSYSPPPGSGALGLDLGWASFTDDVEYVQELKWPQSTKVLEQMRTDSQLSGLYRAMTYPIRRYKFLIDPNGSAPAVYEGIAGDMNLDIVGQDPKPRGRRKGRFSFDNYLFHALLALIYGHMPFEQLGEVGDDGIWHLRKLDPRMPRTINQINVADDGGLISFTQNLTRFGSGGAFGMNSFAGPEIPVDRTVWFAWEKEGPNWPGRSIFRDCYKNWLIKDRLLRIDAINHERAGGVPIAVAPSGASPAEMERLNQLAQQFKVGEHSGGSVPAGTDFNLHKVGGGTDVIASIKYHDESMARLFLHMFLQLGQTETGSRALGDAFIEYAFIAQRAIAQWFIDVTQEHVIEDWVDWNYGEEAQVPLLTYEIEEEDERLAVTDLVAMVDAGLITLDDDLEDSIRHQYHLPERGTPREPVVDPAAVTAPVLETIRAAGIEQYDRIQALILAQREDTGSTIKAATAELEESSKRSLAQMMSSLSQMKPSFTFTMPEQKAPEVHFHEGAVRTDVKGGDVKVEPAQTHIHEGAIQTTVQPGQVDVQVRSEQPFTARRFEYKDGLPSRMIATLADGTEKSYAIKRDKEGKMEGVEER